MKKYKYLVFVLVVLMIGALATGALAGKGGGQAGKSNVAHLYLYEKDPSDWSIVAGGAWGKLKYNLSGAEFEFHFNGHGLEPSTEYSLIYYADPWPGIGETGDAGGLLASGTSNGGGNIHLAGSKEFDENLPQSDDFNWAEPCGDPNTPGWPGPFFCGAKIWLVLTSDYNDGAGPVTLWNASAWLFEDNLISYDDTDVLP